MREDLDRTIVEEITEDTLGPMLQTPRARGRLGRKIYAFQTCESTNLFARRLLEGAQRPEHGTLIVTEYQNAGYGRNAEGVAGGGGVFAAFFADSLPGEAECGISFPCNDGGCGGGFARVAGGGGGGLLDQVAE